MQIIALIQTRYNSTRLPGKALVDICGKPMLQHIVDRVKRAQYVDDVVVATTTNSQPIIDYCIKNGIKYYAHNDEEDILGRMYQASLKFYSPAYVLVWGDCPLVNPKLIDTLVELYTSDLTCDYYAMEGFPKGLEVAVIPYRSLQAFHRYFKGSSDRHWFYDRVKNDSGYHALILKNVEDQSHINLSVDTEGDLISFRNIMGVRDSVSIIQEYECVGRMAIDSLYRDFEESQEVADCIPTT